MEQKSVLLSALGVGVGLGIGLASGQSFGRWVNLSDCEEDELTAKQIEQELKRLIVNGKESTVTFDEFPYILSKRTRELLTRVADIQLKGYHISKFTRKLGPASKAILLSGPGEFYQQPLAKALAHYSESNLLLLDLIDFSDKLHSKYGRTKKESLPKRSISELTMDKVSSLMGSSSMLSQSEVKPKVTSNQQAGGTDLKSRNKDSSNSPPSQKKNASSDISTNLCFDEKLFIESLYKVVASVSETVPLIIYLKDVEKLLDSERFYKLFQRLLKKLSGPVLVLGSRVFEPEDDCQEVLGEGISALFPYNIQIRPPEDKSEAKKWAFDISYAKKESQREDNKKHIAEVLAANDIQCDDFASIYDAAKMSLVLGSISLSHIEEIVVSAISYHLIHTKEPDYRNGKLVISSQSLSHALKIFQEARMEDLLPKLEGSISSKDTESRSGPENKKESEVVPDNEYEKCIRTEVIPANEIGVTFADIGSLDETKESLQELVMLPLRRPDLFKGGLLKPCRGILLFGPPGTGKTMLAKAIANEAGATFINISMSTITSKWFGDDEKIVRALFTLAAKVSPTIIFVDEVDSMLGQRTTNGEHEAMRTIKNEFMTHWDGLMTKPGERILVLAATNRPFDLDEAVIRRFERRIMVGLPSIESREKILRTLLSKEQTDNLDFHELGQMTEGYTGSDLKNLCITAAYRPLRELIEQERLRDQEKKKEDEAEKSTEEVGKSTEEPKEEPGKSTEETEKNTEKRKEEAGKSTEEPKEEKGKSSEEPKEKEAEASEERVITLRPLTMEDMRIAKNQIAASFASEGAAMQELKEWNELYGEGGSRKLEQLTYFI